MDYTEIEDDVYEDQHLPYVRAEHTVEELSYTVVCPQCGWYMDTDDVSWAYEVMFRHVLTDGGGA